ACAAAAGPPPAGAASSPIVLVGDTSGSMADEDDNGRVKIDGAKLALLDFLAGVERGTPLGLRTYPDTNQGDCGTGMQRFVVATRDPAAMSAEIRTLTPDGDTPTAEAMRAAVQDLEDAGYRQGTLVIVSDGLSTCAPPCDAAKEIAQQGIDLETITVGFQITPEGEQELKCIADALDGRYLGAGDADALAQTLDDLTRPQLSLQLTDAHQTVVADTLATVEATIANNGQQQARNVVARLRFDSGSPGVRHPLLHLGNLAPGEQRTVAWTFRTSGAAALRTRNGQSIGQVLRLTAIAYAENTRGDASQRGAVVVVDRSTAEEAGPLLRGKRKLAILGDSYSSGEGADVYLPGTDTQQNGCHKSPYTYLVQTFRLPYEHVVACSGAIANDVVARNGAGVPAQTDELAGLQGGRPDRVDGVVLTIGGNDAHFGALAKSCILSPVACNHAVGIKPSGRFLADNLDNEQLPGALVSTYRAIDTVLNSRRAVAARGGAAAPILVLGYPLPVPLTGRGECLGMLDELTAGEVGFIGRFAARLNGVVEGAVELARDAGVPVFYVHTTESAFLPDHTLCDLGEPFARGIVSLNGADVTVDDANDWIAHNPFGMTDVIGRSIKELAHPNRAGYAAETRAIVRWSLAPEGLDADRWMRSGRATAQAPTSWDASTVNLGQLAPGVVPTLQGGTTYPLTSGGFAPGSGLQVTLHSDVRVLALATADARGRLHTRIAVPTGFPGGEHHLEIAGIAPSGERRVVSIPVRLDGPP
ncbi:MAG: VWA domain-containing protein, partial [Conexibacter sp.]